MPEIIDLRSDTVTLPTEDMKRAMLAAPLGDDVYGEDATVNRLQEFVADMLGKEAGLFVPTGVMSNQLCLKVLTRPGDEVILGTNSHIFNYETGAPALLSGIQLHTIPDEHGTPTLQDVDAAVRESAYYLPRTSVIALEQTHNRAGGVVIPLEKMNEIAQFGHDRGIGMHLDGARIWNASVASGITVKEYARMFDTVSVCLSKGLGAPVGSVMCGSKEQVEVAHKFRKIWGGGWRQAGILAAAGLYAIEHHFPRLGEDHDKAKVFADIVANHSDITIPLYPETNLVVFNVANCDVNELADNCAREGVLVSAAFKGKLRAAFHQDVTMAQTRRAAEVLVQQLQ